MIKQKVLDLREEFVPKIIISNKPKWKFEFPISLDLRKLIKDKNKAHRVWVAHRHYDNSETFRLKYVKLRNRCQQQCRKAKRNYEKGIAEQVKSQPKAFWKFANQKLKTKSCVAPLLANPENPHSLCHDEKDKAEILQKQFVSVHTKEPFGPTPEPPSHILDSVSEIFIPVASVEEKLRNLDISKSCGPDEMHPRILKELCVSIAGPITILFRKSVELGELPFDWKEATVLHRVIVMEMMLVRGVREVRKEGELRDLMTKLKRYLPQSISGAYRRWTRDRCRAKWDEFIDCQRMANGVYVEAEQRFNSGARDVLLNARSPHKNLEECYIRV
ncbi:hypothetical protein Pcinc_004990 [Petrolisthes cinctipes]|uniref:Uncharacterized protein n=1 Tax=Petrolisthes cinctipes TaxID=88211 RepID=A0AAE1GG07_PETCI|nr:hypothetical protein Pcinc_004990 [Petrolisthes cinctipes]